jgi:molybdopterin molybdotransferase
VDLLVTGDELLPAGSPPLGTRIADANSPMLRALLERDGAVLGSLALVPDEASRLEAALRTARGDVVVVTGGSSVGLEDHAPRLLASLGELAFHGIALRPAAPTGLGRLDGRTVFLLPGNPVSCLCAYDLLVGRLLRRLAARDPAWPYPLRRLPLRRKLASVLGRVDYVRVRVTEGEVEPLMARGASILSSTTEADGFVLVPRDLEGWAAGHEVDVWLYDAP